MRQDMHASQPSSSIQHAAHVCFSCQPPTSGLLCSVELFTWLAPDAMLYSSWPPELLMPEPTCCSLLVLLLTILQV